MIIGQPNIDRKMFWNGYKNYLENLYTKSSKNYENKFLKIDLIFKIFYYRFYIILIRQNIHNTCRKMAKQWVRFQILFRF